MGYYEGQPQRRLQKINGSNQEPHTREEKFKYIAVGALACITAHWVTQYCSKISSFVVQSCQRFQNRLLRSNCTDIADNLIFMHLRTIFKITLLIFLRAVFMFPLFIKGWESIDS